MVILNRISFKLFILLISFAALSCDSGNEDAPLRMVTVKYAVSLSDGGRVLVGFADSLGNKVEQPIRENWSYEYQVEEGAHMLFLSTDDLWRAELKAEIFINDEVQIGHVDRDSLEFGKTSIKTSIAWAPPNGTILYLVKGFSIDRATVQLPSGDIRRLYPTQISEFQSEAKVKVEGNANAPISLSVTRPAIAGQFCVDLEMKYLPGGGSEVEYFDLELARTCSRDEIEMAISTSIPSY